MKRMFRPLSPRHLNTRLPFAGLVLAMTLMACAERQEVLPGKREPVSAVFQTETGLALATNTTVGENRAAVISLPAARNNPSWTQGIGSPAYRTDHAALGSSLSLAWAAKIGAGDSRRQRITANPIVGNGQIYTLDAGSTVTATSLAGAQVWAVDLTPDTERDGESTGGGLALDNGTIYASIGAGRLVALDGATGAEKWSQDLDATGSGQPTVFGDLIYLMAGDDTGWAVNKNNGRIAWQITGAESVANVLGAPAPIVMDDLTVFAFGSGELQAVFRQGGLRRWDASVLGERQGRALSKIDDVTGTPVAAGGIIYAGNQAGRTIAVDGRSGQRIWTTGEGAIDHVLPVGGSVFLVSDRNELLRLDANDGSRIWGVPLPNFTKDRPRRRSEVFAHHGPILAGGRLIVASGDGQLRSFDPTNGALLSSVEIPSGATTGPVVAGGVLYVVGRNGQLYAFR